MKRSRENTRKNTKKLSQIPKYITNYQSSETIIKSIIDKIFILAFHEGYSRETDKNLAEYCYDYLKKEMTSFFEINFINYTNSNENNKNSPGELLWEMETPKENTWVEIFEPESEPIDRYESAQILYQEIKRDINNQQGENKNIKKKKSIKQGYNKNTIKEVEEKSSMSGFDGEIKLDNGEIPEISGIENKSSGSLNATDDEIKKNIDNVDNNNIRINEKKATKRRSTKTLSLISTNTLPPVQKKSRKQIIFNYPSSDIPGIEQEYNHQSLEPSNIEILRQEREELIKKKLIESQNEKIINKVKKINEDDKKPKKLFDPKHLTFDSNGKIINFHPYKLDKLEKEFTLIKNLIKGEPKIEDIKTRRNRQYKEKKQESTKDNEENKKMKEILIEKPIPIFEEKTIKEKNKYIPSGSNFQIISPNIGVTIKENNKFKQGSKEFSKYFHKYSLRDYDKMLIDFVPLQNQTLLKNQLKKLNSSSSNDYLSTIQNNNMSNLSKKISNNIMTNSYDLNINNPLLKDAQVMNNNNNTNINNINQNINSSLSNNNYLSSNFNNTINNNIASYKSLNTENSITMKKMGLGSLKLELENLKDLSTINPSLLSRTNRIKNIFRYDSYKDYRKLRLKTEKKINIFSELNKKIMISRDWGNDLSNKKTENIGFNDHNKIISRHISKQQILRELGSNILSGIKIKLPRDRKVDINENNLI